MEKSKSEKLLSAEEKRAQEIRAISDQLNAINYPIIAEVYSHGLRWQIRNVAFWKALKDKEQGFMDQLVKQL